MPDIERHGRGLGLSPEERDEMFRTAPIATEGYEDLIDTVHAPGTSRAAINRKVDAVVSEIGRRALPTESTAAFRSGLENQVERILESK